MVAIKNVEKSLKIEVEGKKKRLNAKKLKSFSCDDDNSRKGPRARDNQPFVLNFDTRPFFIGQEAFIVAICCQIRAQPAN